MWFLKPKHLHIKPELLNEYLDGRLSGIDLAKIERRLQACDVCQDELEELRATIAVVRRMPMEQPRRSFVMDAPPLEPSPARQSFHLRAPAWAYAGAASIAVVALAVLVSVDATGGLSPTADSPEAFVAAAPQSRASAPLAAATAAPAAVAEAAGATALTDQASIDQASAAPEADGDGAAESAVRPATDEGEDSAAFTVTAAAPLSEPVDEKSGTPADAVENAAEPLPKLEPAQAPAVESAPAVDIAEAPGGTSSWWRVLEGVAAGAALAFISVLLWTRRSSRN